MSFKEKWPQFSNDPRLFFVDSDIAELRLPKGTFSHVWHGAATTAAETFEGHATRQKIRTTIVGTERVLDFCSAAGTSRFILLSSGSVYGNNSLLPTAIPEDCASAPQSESPFSTLGLAKRVAEHLAFVECQQTGLAVTVARIFSLAGPLMPLNLHYAFGNFLADGLAGKPIQIKGNPNAIRSYMYFADAVAWLMNLWQFGQSSQPYNVGSSEPISILELASRIASEFSVELLTESSQRVSISGATSHYVPEVSRFALEFPQLKAQSLETVILKTIDYYLSQAS